MLFSGAMVVSGLNACMLQREVRQAQVLKYDSWRDYLDFLSYGCHLGMVCGNFSPEIIAKVLPFSCNAKACF